MLDPDVIRDMVAKGMNSQEIAAEFNTFARKIQHFVRDNNLGPWRSSKKMPPAHLKRPVPDDFKELAKTMSRNAIERYYRRGYAVVTRWYQETGMKPPKLSGTQKTPPDNLAEMAKTKTMMQIAKDLGICRGAVKRMIRDAGIVKERKPPEKPTARVIPFRQNSGPMPTPLHYERDMSRLGLAVEYLKTLGPVSRDGDGWKRGNTRMSSAEIIERADEIREREVRRIAGNNSALRRYGSG